jgi:hypothetical protein
MTNGAIMKRENPCPNMRPERYHFVFRNIIVFCKLKNPAHCREITLTPDIPDEVFIEEMKKYLLSISPEKTEKERSKILQWIGRLIVLPLSLAKRLYRSVWPKYRDQDS